MKNIIKYLKEEFDKIENQIEILINYSTQNEGWFTGNILYFLDCKKKEFKISEIVVDKRRIENIDIFIDINGENYYIEIKNWLTTDSFKLSSFFGKSGSYWKNDLKKLRNINNANYRKYLLIFNNGKLESEENISKIIQKFKTDNRIRGQELLMGKRNKYCIILFKI